MMSFRHWRARFAPWVLLIGLMMAPVASAKTSETARSPLQTVPLGWAEFDGGQGKLVFSALHTDEHEALGRAADEGLWSSVKGAVLLPKDDPRIPHRLRRPERWVVLTTGGPIEVRALSYGALHGATGIDFVIFVAGDPALDGVRGLAIPSASWLSVAERRRPGLSLSQGSAATDADASRLGPMIAAAIPQNIKKRLGGVASDLVLAPHGPPADAHRLVVVNLPLLSAEDRTTRLTGVLVVDRERYPRATAMTLRASRTQLGLVARVTSETQASHDAWILEVRSADHRRIVLILPPVGPSTHWTERFIAARPLASTR